jgi:hypothetical protein
MPTIDTDKLIKEYWEQVKEKYPNFTFEKFEKVCKAPFWFFKSQIESKDTPIIHIKYLGKFRIYSNNVRSLIERNNHRRLKGTIDEETYKKRDKDYQIKLKEAIEYENSRRNKEDTEEGD